MSDSNIHSILDGLNSDIVWAAFLQKKESVLGENSRVRRYAELANNSYCRSVASDIAAGEHLFSIPVKKQISKLGTLKKRTVYTLEEEEMMALRIVSFLLHDYDGIFGTNLFSFRCDLGVRDAICQLRDNPDLQNMYGYKTDIHNYFNSIDVGLITADLKENLNDSGVVDLFAKLLGDDRTWSGGRIIHESKGVMAGLPTSAFLANYHMRDIDALFAKKDCVYMRYADDIILFAKTPEQLDSLKTELLTAIRCKGLDINPKKESCFVPGQSFDFLGFSIEGQKIDLAEATVRKIKGKIRRSVRSIRRWMLKKNAPLEGTLKAIIRRYNEKFYGHCEDELTWERWFFPVITTTKSLKEVDQYMQQSLRYISTGRYCKKNYELVPYDMLQRCGYRPLVAEYYHFLDGRDYFNELSDSHFDGEDA